jgi:chromosome segregation ATPase
MRGISRFVIAALCAVVLVACAGADRDFEVLEENLAAQEQALDALRTRVTDLVNDLGSVRATDPMTGLSQVADRLEGVIDRLADLESDLAQQVRDGDEAAAAAATQFQELTAELNQLRSMVQDLSDQTGSLRAEVDQLRREVEQLREDRD